jgi:hypothetical protein
LKHQVPLFFDVFTIENHMSDFQTLWECSEIYCMINVPRVLIILIQDYIRPRIIAEEMYSSHSVRSGALKRVPKRRQSFSGLTAEEIYQDRGYRLTIVLEDVPRLFFHDKGRNRLRTLDDIDSPYRIEWGRRIADHLFSKIRSRERTQSLRISRPVVERKWEFSAVAEMFTWRRHIEEYEERQQERRAQIEQLERDLFFVSRKLEKEFSKQATLLTRERNKNIKGARDPVWVETTYQENLRALKTKFQDENFRQCNDIRNQLKKLDSSYRTWQD